MQLRVKLDGLFNKGWSQNFGSLFQNLGMQQLSNHVHWPKWYSCKLMQVQNYQPFPDDNPENLNKRQYNIRKKKDSHQVLY